jgi:hypothetical protein
VQRCANGHTSDAGYTHCPACGLPLADDGQAPTAAFGQQPADPATGYTPPPPFGEPQPPVAPPGYYPPQYSGPYPGPYPPAYYPQYPPPRPTNGLAIASLVLGVLWIYWFGSILALVFGYVARRQIREENQDGAGLALAGIVLGWIGVATLLAVIVFVLSFAAYDWPTG